jgi:hypothetical protein
MVSRVAPEEVEAIRELLEEIADPRHLSPSDHASTGHRGLLFV